MSTDALIEKLSLEPAAKPAVAPAVLFAKWMAVSVLYIIALLMFFGLRPDLITCLHAPMFISEVGLLATIAVSSAVSAMLLSYPDMLQKRWVVYTPVLPLSVFLILLYVMWQQDTAPMPPNGMDCVLCISLFTLVPAGWMLFSLRKLASTHYYLAGGISLIAASSLGCLALRLVENTDSVRHLVTWHYLPMIGFGTIGLFLGKKILKW